MAIERDPNDPNIIHVNQRLLTPILRFGCLTLGVGAAIGFVAGCSAVRSCAGSGESSVVRKIATPSPAPARAPVRIATESDPFRDSPPQTPYVPPTLTPVRPTSPPQWTPESPPQLTSIPSRTPAKNH